jgi:hypothetical protein
LLAVAVAPWGGRHTVGILSEGSRSGDGLPSISGTEAAGVACAAGRWRLNPSKRCRQMTLALKPSGLKLQAIAQSSVAPNQGGETEGAKTPSIGPPVRRVNSQFKDIRCDVRKKHT